jgi:hypothetical protein
MKILFLGRRYMYFRNFDTVLRELASRGHQIHLAVETGTEDDNRFIAPLLDEFPNLTCGEVPSAAADDWSWTASRLRLGLDHLRYVHPLYDDTPMLRERSRERTPGMFVALCDWLRTPGLRWLRRPATALTHRLETAIPTDPAIRDFIEQHRPDIVLLTPLIDLGSSQIDYLRAAREARIPTALCVWSWDHLSSKALIREQPDRVFVWNHTQQQEAVDLHGVPGSRVVVTGAQCFDKWFNRRPSRDRAAFCAQIGLPADRPYILYVCSAPFIGSQPEAPFVADWVRRIRTSSDPTLRDTPILVRPHPSRVKEWDAVDLNVFENVVLWGGNPIDVQARADYFDSLYHSVAVAGLNTSAFIEAGIVGRPVHTILLPEWHENQMGTVHFRYLFNAGGGLLNAAHSFDEHLAQLATAVTNPSAEIRPFVRTFVRPHGLDVAATPLFVEAVEELAGVTPAPVAPDRFRERSLRLLDRLRALRGSEQREWWLYSERELESIHRMREGRKAKAIQRRDERLREEARKRERQEQRARDLAEHRAAKAAQDASRLDRIAEKERERVAEKAVKQAAKDARRAAKERAKTGPKVSAR